MSSASEDSDEAARFAELLEEVGRASPIPLSALVSLAPKTPRLSGAERFFLPGERLLNERFILGEKLGEGGMGVVYEAFDAERGGPVALKFLSRVDPASILRFKLEFRSLADVVHPHLSRMHALFCWQGSWFFSMDLLRGKSLFAHYRALDDATAKVAFLRSALPQLEAGLSALHGMGKLHCDLKPSNVFVSPQGHVTIVDFGLVVDPGLGVYGHALGTPGYMAPELLMGEAPSPASDWYALGVMLHQALTSQLPTVNSAFARTQRGPQWSALQGTLPADLCAICAALLRADPKGRAEGVALLRGLGRQAEGPVLLPLSVPQLGCVGRRNELRVLGEALLLARAGKRVLCRVSGPSGAGKTTLLRAFLESLDARDCLVLSGRCFEREFTPFKLLEGVVDALASALVERPLVLPEEARPAFRSLARAFPSMGKLGLVQPPSSAHGPRLEANEPERSQLPKEQRRQLREALCTALHWACNGRVAVMAIDDAHWTDRDGAALCASLLETAPPLVLILVQRDEPEVLELDQLARAVVTQGGALVDLAVGSLSSEDMLELVRRLPVAAHVVPQDIAREAQGSPYLALELMRYAHRRVQHTASPFILTLGQALRARVVELPHEALTTLQLVAISGAPLEVRVLARAFGAEDTDRAVAFLRAHSLLRGHAEASEAARVDVYHDRVRKTVLDMLVPKLRRELHGRLGDALEVVKPWEVERLTLHFQAACQPERALAYAWQAGRRAASSLAFEQAVSFLAQAQSQGTLAAADAAQLAREFGDALAVVGRAAEAGAQYLRAAMLSEQPGRLALLAAGQLLCGGQLEQGFEILRANLQGRQGPLPSLDKLPQAISSMFAKLLRLLAAPVFSAQPLPDSDAAMQVDACYWAALGLAGSDIDGTGSYLLLRQAVEALELGEPLRIVRALEVTAALGSCTQSPFMAAWIMRMVEVATRVAAPLSDPRIAFWREFRRAGQAHWAFDQATKHQHVAAAERCASACHGVQRERVILWFFCGFSDFEAGRLQAHFERAAQVHSEALRCKDLHAEIWSELIDLRPLLCDEPRVRLSTLRALPTRYGDALTGIPTYALEWQIAVAERASELVVDAHARMRALLARARKSPFWSMPRNRGLVLSEAVACCLARGTASVSAEPWSSEAEALLEEHPAPSLWLLPYRAGIAALRGDLPTTRRLLAETCSHAEVENGFWVTRSARLLLAAREGDARAMRQAEHELLQAGVKTPRKFAQLVVPGVHFPAFSASF